MPDLLQDADRSGMSVCLACCDDCRWGDCPGVPHTSGNAEDWAHAWANYQEPPGFCDCECGRPARSTKVVIRSVPALAYLRNILGFESVGIWTWTWQCPGCVGGTAMSQERAGAEAAEHRTSDKCRHRRNDA